MFVRTTSTQHYLIGYLSSSTKKVGFVANLDQTSSCDTVPVESYYADESLITLITTVTKYSKATNHWTYSAKKFVALDVPKSVHVKNSASCSLGPLNYYFNAPVTYPTTL